MVEYTGIPNENAEYEENEKILEYMREAEKICLHCPEFLLPTVIESILRPFLDNLSRDDHYELLINMYALDRSSEDVRNRFINNVESFKLALEVLEDTFTQGVESYFSTTLG
mmetsp:Transcript_4050/g.4684  ORF Transcript_4050/g.4684 Transcript_4050/m.4684 type:complete len:112 (-) Transcript_4050:318-653(-)|eukprot:CAMPEP_0184019666 /NCGR_PEP_ID=MMETSP0954-20121128/8885_1 /TAXON_ID=627963 /ORGANISM="Aplanochytrium sp, Strain PBS07" /LENGTH=111 /DNA_ID=CAMNT_0026301371 /DNA_START=606 /DNA_END=941 /DNA_ORIENTATION=+